MITSPSLRSLLNRFSGSSPFDDFSPSQRTEYIEWVTEAKGEDTRARRIEQAVQWMSQGKTRHWKFQK